MKMKHQKNIFQFLLLILLFAVQYSHLRAQMISCGSEHSIFLCNTGNPVTCGYNNYGQLGDGSANDKNTAAGVGTLSGIVAVDGGGHHSLFLRNDGTVWSCGWNIGGSLGDGSLINRSSPVQVSGLTNISAISAGRINSLFLKSDSTAWACGYNWYGSLGDGTTNTQTLAVQVNGLNKLIAVSSGGQPTIGDFSLFLKRDGTVWGCGYNGYGAIGMGTLTQQHVPAQIPGLTGVKAISAGAMHSLFLKNDGTVWVCGDNQNGFYGIGNPSVITTPTPIPLLNNIKAISAGMYHSLFLKDDGTVWACGGNVKGELGDGSTFSSTVPVQCAGITNAIAISAGEQYSLIQKNDGSIWAFGSNSKGQLSIGSFDNNPHPNAISVSPQCAITSTHHFGAEEDFSIYPNPASTQLYLSHPNSLSNATFIILDLQGSVLMQKDLLPNGNAITELEDLSNGVYIFEIRKDGVKKRSGKLIIVK